MTVSLHAYVRRHSSFKIRINKTAPNLCSNWPSGSKSLRTNPVRKCIQSMEIFHFRPDGQYATHSLLAIERFPVWRCATPHCDGEPISIMIPHPYFLMSSPQDLYFRVWNLHPLKHLRIGIDNKDLGGHSPFVFQSRREHSVSRNLTRRSKPSDESISFPVPQCHPYCSKSSFGVNRGCFCLLFDPEIINTRLQYASYSLVGDRKIIQTKITLDLIPVEHEITGLYLEG